MDYGFTIYERLILEELAAGRSNVDTIADDLGIQKKIISKTIDFFKKRGIVDEEKGYFTINLENFRNHVASFKGNSRLEILELLEGLASANLKEQVKTKEVQTDKTLKMKKVYLDEGQTKILNTLFHGIEKYLGDIETENQSNKRSSSVQNKQLICWGHCNYLTAAKQVISSV